MSRVKDNFHGDSLATFCCIGLNALETVPAQTIEATLACSLAGRGLRQVHLAPETRQCEVAQNRTFREHGCAKAHGSLLG